MALSCGVCGAHTRALLTPAAVPAFPSAAEDRLPLLKALCSEQCLRMRGIPRLFPILTIELAYLYFLCQRNTDVDGRMARLRCVFGIDAHRGCCGAGADLVYEILLLRHASSFCFSLLTTASQNIYHTRLSTLDIFF